MYLYRRPTGTVCIRLAALKYREVHTVTVVRYSVAVLEE